MDNKIKYVDLNGLKVFAEALKQDLKNHVLELGLYQELLHRIENLELYKIVDSLPEIGDEDTIYLLKNPSGSGDKNIFIEYLYNNEHGWEEIGNFTPSFDLEDYVKVEDAPFEKGSAENSAVLKGEYEGYSNKAISQTSMAVGAGTTAGLKGYYINYAHATIIYISEVNTELLDSEPSIDSNFINPYEVGDVYSIHYGTNYYNVGKITSINHNKITVDSAVVPTKDAELRYHFYVFDKADKGVVDIGECAYTEGIENKAYNVAAHAEGYGNKSLGKYSHTEGKQNEAHYCAHAEGSNNKSTGNTSHTEGTDNIASNSNAHAEGRYTTASGYGSHAEGYGENINNRTVASGDGSHAEGRFTEASGKFAHAEGEKTKAIGLAAHAEGLQTTAEGQASHVEGRYTYAKGVQSHAEGYGKQDGSTGAFGAYSHSEGQYTTASGNKSHSEGTETNASADSAHAEGLRTAANGMYSHAEGRNTITNNTAEHACGIFNKSTASSDTSKATHFSIGIGKSDTDRKNAFEVRQNGDIYVEGVEGRIQDRLNTNIDSALSDTSTNPVQNKAIVAALATKTNENDVKELIALEHIYFLYKADENKLYFKGLDALDNWRLVLPYILNITFGKPLTPHLSIATNDGTINISTNDFEINVSMGEYNMTWSYNGKKFSLVFDESGREQIITSQDIDYVTAQQLTELSAKVGELEEQVPSVFEAVFGVTTYDEIVEAVKAKKHIICFHKNRVYNLCNFQQGRDLLFTCATAAIYTITLKITDSKWVESQYDYEIAINKVTTINENSTNTKYPSAKAVYDATQKMMPTTPSGDPMHYMFEAAGATYNATDEDIPMVGVYGDSYVHKAKHWHLNELGDINNEEMRKIFYCMQNCDSRRWGRAFAGMKCRTNLPFHWYGKLGAQQAVDSSVFTNSAMETDFETLLMPPTVQGEIPIFAQPASAFYNSQYLRKILNTFRFENTPTTACFLNCHSLEEFRLQGISFTLVLNSCENLSNQTILYMIQQEAATSGITLTLHPSAYARAIADAEITAALADHPNVSLASA